MNAWDQAGVGPVIEVVVAKATRRRFTVEYKRKIVREADACKTPGTGVTKTHSRPHVSNDNPYSEAHFQECCSLCIHE